MAGSKCGANKADGGKCGNPAGYRTDHVGRGPCYLHFGCTSSVRKAVFREEAVAWGLANQLEIDPGDALTRMVWAAAGAVKWAADHIADEGVDEPGSVWVAIYAEERDRLAKTAKMALDANVEERSVRMVEQQGEMVAIVIRRILDALDLTPEQQAKAPKVVRTQLAALPVSA